MVLAAYATAWAAFLTSDLAVVGGPISFPPVLICAVAGLAMVHVALGVGTRSWWSAAASAIPPLLALAMARWIPPDPDVPHYPATLALLLTLVVTPTSATLTASAVALAKLRDRGRGARSAGATRCARAPSRHQPQAD